mgnify:CR=1 FL=1
MKALLFIEGFRDQGVDGPGLGDLVLGQLANEYVGVETFHRFPE